MGRLGRISGKGQLWHKLSVAQDKQGKEPPLVEDMACPSKVSC